MLPYYIRGGGGLFKAMPGIFEFLRFGGFSDGTVQLPKHICSTLLQMIAGPCDSLHLAYI
jgi:hypothetical protein